MSWIILFAGALVLLALAFTLLLVWDTRPPPTAVVQGEREVSVLNYYRLGAGKPVRDDLACLHQCDAAENCAAVLTSDRGASCQLLSREEVAKTSLEALTAQPGYVYQNDVPPPAAHVYFGRGAYSTQGRYWVAGRGARVIRQELAAYHQLPWRPQSIVAPPGTVGLYTPARLAELPALSPAQWPALEGELPVYIHYSGEPLQVPTYWKQPWVIYV